MAGWKERCFIGLAILIVLAGLTWRTVQIRKLTVERAAVQTSLRYGVGVCHWVPKARPHDAVTWGYETTPPVFWGRMEPEKDRYDFSLIDKYAKERLDSGLEFWISVQTGSVGMDGQRKAPQWLFDEGAVWIGGSCNKDGMIPPWDAVYQERLPLLLAAINAHIAGWDEERRNLVAGVVAMSGGMYGEMQVSSCNVKEAMKAHYGFSEERFNAVYGDAIALLADFYFEAFPDMDIMWQVGYNVTKTDAALEQRVVDYLVMLYSDRLFIKWAGLDPVCGLNWQQRANRYYQDMFKKLAASGIRVGYEPKAAAKYQSPIGSGIWDAEKFEEIFVWAKNSGASFMCFSPKMISALLDVPGWQRFDAALEANAPTLLPTPTPTRAPLFTRTPTRVPTATRILTATPTPTPRATATPPPTPMNCWIVVGDQRYRFDCWKENSR